MITAPEILKGVLPVVISGGRPQLRQRMTGRLLKDLHGITADPVWIVRADEACGYEPDGHEIVTYPRQWAYDYARAHWTGMEPLADDGFHGCCAGRETGCLTAEERGYWAVLMLDDNIHTLTAFNGYPYAQQLVRDRGGMAYFADMLAAITQSTNGWMVGAFLDSVNPKYKFKTARVGFPYSLFVERVGPGREHWYGPVEADIIHAYQYGYSNVGTALVSNPLHYKKNSTGGGGMRRGYNNMRAVALQRMFPESSKLLLRATTSNGKGDPRVFHYLQSGAIRNPLVVKDPALYAQVTASYMQLSREFTDGFHAYLKEKVTKRAAKTPSFGGSGRA